MSDPEVGRERPGRRTPPGRQNTFDPMGAMYGLPVAETRRVPFDSDPNIPSELVGRSAGHVTGPSEAAVPTGVVEGTDPTAAVSVTLDTTGRLSDLRISSQWRARVGAHGFASALAHAVREATAMWSDQISREPENHRHSRSENQPLGSTFDDFTVEETIDFSAHLAELVEEAAAELDQQMERGLAVATAGYRGEDDRGNVAVLVTSTCTVVGLHVDESWLRSSSLDRMTGTIRNAFESAYRQADRALETLAGRATPAATQVEAVLAKIGLSTMDTR